jgi:hypothetical protein
MVWSSGNLSGEGEKVLKIEEKVNENHFVSIPNPQRAYYHVHHGL